MTWYRFPLARYIPCVWEVGASRLRVCPPEGNEEAIERITMGDSNTANYDGG
jgi:hypothetical protein